MDIKSMTLDELKDACQQMGEKPFRAKQLYDWMHHRLAGSYDEMTNLSLAFREKLKEQYPLTCLEKVQVQESKIDGTRKYLFRLSDGNVIESVWMKYHHGNSVCISSQVGCRMGCRFCASTQAGRVRNLEAGEICSEIYTAQKDIGERISHIVLMGIGEPLDNFDEGMRFRFCASTIGGLVRCLTPSEMLDQIYRIWEDTGERVSNLVVMGTGEPMDNYDNLVRFVRLLSSQEGLNISQRNITVSTCGIVPNMYKLADEGLQITLALSLHAPNDEKRRELMPIANKYSIDEILDACRNYFAKTGRRITFEYSLVGGKNDSEADAKELSARISDINCHVNLIPVNPIKERDYVKSTKKVVENFKNKLEKYGINVTIRREMGADIDGACGQLRKSFIDKSNEQP